MKWNSLFSKTSLVALSALLLYSCNKEETPLSNVDAFRNDASQAQVLDMTSINTDMTLKDRVNGVDYLILNNVEINANLSIQPGVTLMFENGAGIQVNAEGSITAIGEKANEIYFTSKAGKRGAWKGITILSSNAKNVLTYCKVEHGGGTNSFGAADIVIGTGNNAAMAEISNSVITASNTDGILLSQGSKLNYFTSNSIQTNSAYGITMYAADEFTMDNTNIFTNNGKDAIHVINAGNGFEKKIDSENRVH